MRLVNPTPWELIGQTILDANGDVVVSAINPCDMETRKMIVAAVNTRKVRKPANSKLCEALGCAKEKALYISRNYTTPNSLTGNILELLAYLNAAIAATASNPETENEGV